MNLFKAGKYEVGIFLKKFFCLAVEAGFESDVVENLPVDPTTKV